MKVDVTLGIIQAKGAIGEHFETCSYFIDYSRRLKKVAEAAAKRALHTENHVIQSWLTFGLQEKDVIASCLQVSTVFSEKQSEVEEFIQDWKTTED